MFPHTEKNRGAAHFAARGLHVGNGVGCPWAAHGYFAMQIRLPTISIYGNSGQLSGQLSRLPTTSIYGNSGQLSGQRSGLPMGILSCKLGCQLLPYMETVGSSVGSQLLPNVKKVGSSVGSGVDCPWAAHGNYAMQIRLPTTSIYGYSGQLSVQLSGQPTTFKYGYSGHFSGHPTELPTKNGSHLRFTCKKFVAHVYIYCMLYS